MLANILPADPPPSTLGMVSIGQNSTFSEMVMLNIKLKGITNAQDMVADIFLADPHTPPPPPLTTLGVWSIDPNSTFSEQGHVAYQIKGNECSNMVVIIFLTDHP